jgi:hypothetical protein
MPKPTLLVCQSCHSTEDRPDDQRADGDRLYQQLNTLAAEQLADLEIQAVGCLWTCDQPCAVAYTAADVHNDTSRQNRDRPAPVWRSLLEEQNRERALETVS